jgi:hypothetical protein
MTIKQWLWGFFGGAISGGAVALSAVLVDVTSFSNWGSIGKLFLIGAIVGGVAYVKKSPWPDPTWDGVDRRSATTITTALLIVALALGVTGCALKASPRTKIGTAAVTVSDALIAANDFEKANHVALGLSAETHRAFLGAMSTAMTIAARVDRTVAAWPTDTPAPDGLRVLILELKADLDVALNLLPPSSLKDSITSKLAAVWSLVGLVLGS